MLVKFIYSKTKENKPKESVLSKVCQVASQFVDLPTIIYIQFATLDIKILGETVIDIRNNNKILLNSVLTIKESVLVLSHELIHLSQIHTGKLSLHKNGNYIWEGKQYFNLAKLRELTYQEYQELPWELDVVKKQQNLLINLLKN